MLPDTPRTFLFGQTLGLDTEELRMLECISIAKRHEHTVVVAPVSSTPYFLQSCWKAHWALDEWPATSRATQGTHLVVYWKEVRWQRKRLSQIVMMFGLGTRWSSPWLNFPRQVSSVS